MADLKLNITGDSSSGQAAMDGMADATGRSVVVWQELANMAKAAGKAVVDFLVDSTKKYAESEKALRQLSRASDEYAGALEEQAKALMQLYAVDDDLIIQSETLLAQWGGAAAASKEAETAALNLASAMGTDLNSATRDLIRNVESGGIGLAKMGIHFKETGDKGKDLAAAVEAINKKLGGAAAADAGSLTGSLHAASLAFEDIQKSIGGSVAQFLQQNGIVERLTEAMRGLNTLISGPDAHIVSDAERLQNQEHLLANIQQRKNLLAGIADIEARGGSATASRAMVAHLDENIAKLKEILRLDAARIGAGDPTAPGVSGLTNKGVKDAANAPAVMAHQQIADAHDNIYRHEEESAQHTFTKIEKMQKDLAKSSADGEEAEAKRAAEAAEKLAREEAAAEEKASKDATDRTAKQAQQWAHAGDSIGAAFVNGLSDQLQKLSQGEEFDVAIFVGDILASAIAVAGTVIGSAYGQPELGAALGNLAAMGVRAGAGAISKGSKKAKTYHDGGWVDAPRHHEGSWIGDDERRAILQTGERVLSRNEVHHMGGPGAVDGMAKGRGPAINNYIQAIDSKNAAESFMADLGQGMKRALRTGHGDVPRLLGNPR